jgi:AbrB family looped-hinge helix DNA binding protein
MSLTIETRVGKKYVIYLPKLIVKAIDLREGERVLLRVVEDTIVLEKLKDPIELALSEEKFASIKIEQIEAISLEEQKRYAKSSS